MELAVADAGAAPRVRLRHDVASTLGSVLTIAWLIATAWPMLRYSVAAADPGPLVAHGAAFALALAAFLARERSHPLLRVLRDWCPLLLGPFLYIELRWLIAGLGRPHLDAIVRQRELWLFASDPSRALATAWPSPALSEALHAAYLSFYLIVYVPAAALYLQRRRDAFALTVLTTALAFGCCFAIFLLYPVDGPRYLAASPAPAGVMRDATLRLLTAGSARGTAFPSAHVTVAVACTLCAWRFQRRVGVIVAVLTVGLAAGAVYGGFHYAIDVVVGALAGVGVTIAAARVWRIMPGIEVGP